MAERDFPAGALGHRAAEWLAGRGFSPVEPRTAATVMLVRDGSDGVDVFMLRRVSSMEFAAGMWVFPGGGVDPRDASTDVPWAGPSASSWAAMLGCEEGLARSLVCAAVREVFEECGVLLAGPSASQVVADLRDPEWDRERAALLAREQSLAELLARRGLVLRSDLLSAQGHWMTPEFEKRRYNTWFFAALLPEGQSPDDATREAEVADWTLPAYRLEEYAAGEALMMPPTVVSCERVAAAGSAAEFVASSYPTTLVLPRLVEVDGTPVIRADLPA